MASSYASQSLNYKTVDMFANTSNSINECLKQFNDFTFAINEVCNQAIMFGRSLQTLEDLTIPEIIGGEQVKKTPSKKFKSSAHLTDSLDTFSKIMMSFSERIRIEAIDTFDNFIVQAVAPNAAEIKGIQDHNSQIVNEFREAFFSLYNHFLILAAELMEKFLICSNCSIPIGFPHKPLCLTKSLIAPNVWKKTKYDDKFITFGMKFSFNEIIAPGCRKNILTQIENSCLKQSITQRREKLSLPSITKSWPSAWIRDEKEREKKPMQMQMRKTYSTPDSGLPPFGHRSIWTPTGSDERVMVTAHHQKFKGFGHSGFN